MDVRIVDGGLSTALEEAGHRLDDPLWTARLLIDDPEAIVAAHLAFLRAGARVLITSSYQASEDGLVAAGLRARGSGRRASIDDGTCRRGPGTVRRGGSGCGRGRCRRRLGRAVRRDALRRLRVPRARLWTRTRSLRSMPARLRSLDRHAARTCSRSRRSRRRGRHERSGARSRGWTPVPAWMSFTCRDGATTWGGEPIEDVVTAAAAIPSVIAVGVNCTAPAHVAPLLERIGRVTDLPLVAYPNGGQSWDAVEKVWIGAEAGRVGRRRCGVGQARRALRRWVLRRRAGGRGDRDALGARRRGGRRWNSS